MLRSQAPQLRVECPYKAPFFQHVPTCPHHISSDLGPSPFHFVPNMTPNEAGKSITRNSKPTFTHFCVVGVGDGALGNTQVSVL